MVLMCQYHAHQDQRDWRFVDQCRSNKTFILKLKFIYTPPQNQPGCIKILTLQMSEVAVECGMRHDTFADVLKETTPRIYRLKTKSSKKINYRQLLCCPETQSRSDCLVLVNPHHHRDHQLSNSDLTDFIFYECFCSP